MTQHHPMPSLRGRRRRRLPRPHAAYEIDLEIGDAFENGEATALDHFLTARWRLFTTHGRYVATTPAEHPPWPLHHARVTRLEETLLRAAGVPAPSEDPIVHFSPGVDTRIGPPRVVKAKPPS